MPSFFPCNKNFLGLSTSPNAFFSNVGPGGRPLHAKIMTSLPQQTKFLQTLPPDLLPVPPLPFTFALILFRTPIRVIGRSFPSPPLIVFFLRSDAFLYAPSRFFLCWRFPGRNVLSRCCFCRHRLPGVFHFPNIGTRSLLAFPNRNIDGPALPRGIAPLVFF